MLNSMITKANTFCSKWIWSKIKSHNFTTYHPTNQYQLPFKPITFQTNHLSNRPPFKPTTIQTDHHSNRLPFKPITIQSVQHSNRSPFKPITIQTDYHSNRLPFKPITIQNSSPKNSLPYVTSTQFWHFYTYHSIWKFVGLHPFPISCLQGVHRIYCKV